MVVVLVRAGIFIAKRAVYCVLVIVDGLDIALIIEFVVELGVRHMVGLVMVVARRLVVMGVVRLRVDGTVMGLGVTHGVNVVRVHRVVVVRVLVRGRLTLNVMVSDNAVLAFFVRAASMTIVFAVMVV